MQGGAAVAVEVAVDGLGEQPGVAGDAPQRRLAGDEAQRGLGQPRRGLDARRRGAEAARLALRILAALDPLAQPVEPILELLGDERLVGADFT